MVLMLFNSGAKFENAYAACAYLGQKIFLNFKVPTKQAKVGNLSVEGGGVMTYG